ncbi:MAG TPA: rhodanese-like domain-containing protein [Gemmatimonadaceae bacterium]|nr:rhodanese-like domain-containing protein [Gemmatimonadaceae bacterium]
MTAVATIPPVVAADDLGGLLEAKPDIRILDVRTPAEYETVHIPGAYNVPLDLLGEHGREIRFNVAEPVVLVCQSGQRARKAEEALRVAGMPNLHVLDGGMNAWVSAGRPVVRGVQRVSLERQVRIAAGAFVALGGALALSVSPAFAVFPALMGAGLVFSGLTNTCGIAMVLARLPYNRTATCDVSAMVRALVMGDAPAPVGRSHRRDVARGTCAT